ncbi:DUF2487 family protein [Paenibacillus gansuensis]|uniref:DUF2487 family protein n=1 Tax=Paenibacillus gansuensis TaxID=306542 RepID=A0ABW5PA10_9BACL
MKFSEIKESEWTSLQPYLDTCLLPVTGLKGDEEPWQAAAELERLRDVLDLIEIPYKGRTVTYPALHYITEDARFADHLDAVCEKLKAGGFRYVILVTAGELKFSKERKQADLIINPALFKANLGRTRRTVIDEQILGLWHGTSDQKG